MEVSTISLEHTGRFNKLILDHVNGDDGVREFYGLPHSLENYTEQIESRKKFAVDRELLADSLLKQYETIGGAKGSVLSNIESLRSENAFTVTTGHQLNIFTGPLYFVYKILHTIKLTEQLREAYPDTEFIPVYWMNSEDHDLDEVGQFSLFGKKYVWETAQTGATGRMNPAGLEKFCDELEEVFSNNEETKRLVAVFRTAYSKFERLSDATRYFANEFFGNKGLVVFDSDDADLKRPFLEYFRKDFDGEPFNLVRETNQKLEKAGYRVQVNPRQVNSFYLADGMRNRIVETEKGFKVFQTDIRFTKSELESELKSHPERFSPNVVLRPLFQEFILPNLTYVGGAGELSYWLQYRSYFGQMGVSFPMLSLRNHFLLIDHASSKRMSELKLLPEDLFHSIDELVKAHVLEVSDADVNLDKELDLLTQMYDALKQKANDIDASLAASLEAEQTRMQKSVEQWGGRFSRALKQQNEVSVNRIRKLHAHLFPNGFLQERHINFLQPYSKSESTFWSSVYDATEPFSTEFRVLILD